VLPKRNTLSKHSVNKKIKKPIGHFLMFVIIILLVTIIFITVGWAANKLLEEEKLLTLDDKKRRLKTVEDKLMELQLRKEEIKRKERQVLLFSRLFVACVLLFANYLYMKHYKIPFDLKRSSNEMLRFNSFVLLGYSFIAFMEHLQNLWIRSKHSSPPSSKNSVSIPTTTTKNWWLKEPILSWKSASKKNAEQPS